MERRAILPLVLAALTVQPAGLAEPGQATEPSSYEVPDDALPQRPPSRDLRQAAERYLADRAALLRFWDAPLSAARDRALKQFEESWLAALDKVDFNWLDQHGRVDYILFRNRLTYEIRQSELSRKRTAEMRPLIPFAETIVGLHEGRRRMESPDPAKLAAVISQLDAQIRTAAEAVAQGRLKAEKAAGNRAAQALVPLRDTLRRWYLFHNGYDPMFTWWVTEPYKRADASLEKYAAALRERIAGVGKDDRDAIIGDPVGREALLSELAREMIPYTPEELIAVGRQELAWCEAEMRRASRELGYGDDWRKALEHVKTLHAPPGQQPALIRDLAWEAIAFVRQHDLVTVPKLARESWRMEMMTPEQQRINPFFRGGEVITVSYPTDAMTHEQKLMSMRGNNIHFARATVFHELIPGHHLAQFMQARYRPYRRLFNTSFWGEGWALHWEMMFWDLGFARSPENRIGMLLWRMHRCARIIFSLAFHLGQMTAPECVDLLVDGVGHERENAVAEVRRSFEGEYGPLYQCAYMVGALQMRALHKELVGAAKMTNREFHDAVLKLNSIPLEMVRASLTNQPLTKEYVSAWKFLGEVKGQ